MLRIHLRKLESKMSYVLQTLLSMYKRIFTISPARGMWLPQQLACVPSDRVSRRAGPHCRVLGLRRSDREACWQLTTSKHPDIPCRGHPISESWTKPTPRLVWADRLQILSPWPCQAPENHGQYLWDRRHSHPSPSGSSVEAISFWLNCFFIFSLWLLQWLVCLISISSQSWKIHF